MAREAPAVRPAPTKGSNQFEHDAHAPGTLKHARRLRSDMTASEKKLWSVLKKLNLGIRRQAPIGRYIADFAHHSARLVIEVDSSRHHLDDAQLHDAIRDDWLRSQGYRVLRVRDEQAYGDPWSVAEEVKALIERISSAGAQRVSPGAGVDTPSPNPPPLRGRALRGAAKIVGNGQP